MVIASLQTNTATISLCKGKTMYTVTTRSKGNISNIRYGKEYQARNAFIRTAEHYIRLGGLQ